ncbi:hypothetical protein JCM10908_002446 [Rhodotorula pacifica]|uniref:TFIIH/NER complex subunit SSL1 n=1 Tax=Rhodotorula pacifica TaxID=1495444 RepID=UPI00318054C4
MSRPTRRDRDFIAEDDESLSEDDRRRGGRGDDHDPEDESDLDMDNSSDDDNAVSRMKKRSRSRTAAVGTRSKSKAAAATGAGGGGRGRGKAWEGQFERTWDQVQEDEHGTLEGAVSDLLLSSKSRRVLRDSASIQRGIIRHVYLVIDLSSAMLVRDYKQTWLDLTLQYAQEFVTEFFDQNPIGQMAIMVTRDGLAERLTPLSGNPADHLKVLQNKKKLEPRGQPSLQNVLQLAKTGLSHLPPHGSREVIIVLGSLTTCDPTNIHQTIADIEKERIRVNIIGLSADMKICRDICENTRGVYRVARDDLAFRDLLFEFVSPPPTISAPSRSHLLGGPSSAPPSSSADLMQMGFPALLTSTYPGVCACHGKLKTTGYGCPRCRARLCDVPTECRVCGLTVVNAPQLARSYRHLFPVTNYDRVTEIDATAPPACFSCTFPFSSVPPNTSTTTAAVTTKATSSTNKNPTTTGATSDLSPLGRYACPKCGHQFCLECDRVVHEALGFCPGCTSTPAPAPALTR